MPVVCIASSHALSGLGVSSDFFGAARTTVGSTDDSRFTGCQVWALLVLYSIERLRFLEGFNGKISCLIFETILLNYTGPSVDKPLLFSFVFLFGGGELFKMSKMIFVFL